MMRAINAGGYTIHIEAANQKAPVIYIHVLSQFVQSVVPSLSKVYDGPVSVVTVEVPVDEWSNILAPWNTPEGWPQYVACTGGANEYAKTFLNEIMPAAEQNLDVSDRYIAGYSLAGLFALYLFTKTDKFKSAACPSGSFWFPNFGTWFDKQELKRIPTAVFFSCSRDEYYSDNEYLAPVRDNLKLIEQKLKKAGTKTAFVLDAGDHYEDVLQRTVYALCWVLRHA